MKQRLDHGLVEVETLHAGGAAQSGVHFEHELEPSQQSEEKPSAKQQKHRHYYISNRLYEVRLKFASSYSERVSHRCFTEIPMYCALPPLPPIRLLPAARQCSP